MAKYLDSTGITTLWNKIKGTFLTQGGGMRDISMLQEQQKLFRHHISI